MNEQTHAYVLGVDGGNTKTIALVARMDGTIVGAGRGGCSDIYNARPLRPGGDPAEAALLNIDHAVMGALEQAGITPEEIHTSLFNMAGVDWPEDIDFVREAMTERGYGRQITLQNDALGLLTAGIGAEWGVSVIIGTGGAIGARAPDGRIWHTSYWQDEVQGGSQLAANVLFAVYRSELGISPPTSLTRRVLDYFGVTEVEEILHRQTGRNQPPLRDDAGLPPLLFDEADRGDAAAQAIVRAHGEGLGTFVLAAARKVGIEGMAFPLVMSGGIFRHPSPLLPQAIVDQVRTTSPAVQSRHSPYEPAICVVMQALELACGMLTEGQIMRVRATIPDHSLFTTQE
jgi:N-acetylglucosamine kinase-like BadF-type ATPase